VGRFGQAVQDTLLDWLARRYNLSTAYVQSLKSRRDDPLLPSAQRPDLHRALDRLDEIERDRQARAASTQKLGEKGRQAAEAELQKERALNEALRLENQRLRNAAGLPPAGQGGPGTTTPAAPAPLAPGSNDPRLHPRGR